jgi:Zn-dependent protease
VCYFNFLRYENEFVGYFALVNLVIGFFNLLPVKGLDGGTALFSLLCKFCDINKATVMVRILSLFVATVVLITAVMLIVKGNPNLSLFIMGVYLVVMSVMKM